MKNKNLCIGVVVVILCIITVGLSGYIISNKLKAEYEIEKNIDNYTIKFNKDACVNLYVDIDAYDETLSIIANNKNINYQYKQDQKEHFVNGKLLFKEAGSDIPLRQLCNYDDYLLSYEGFESQDTINIIDKNGELAYTTIGYAKYEDEILYITSIGEKVYKEISLDLKNDLKETLLVEEKFNCNDFDPYSVYKDEQKEAIKQYCYGP